MEKYHTNRFGNSNCIKMIILIIIEILNTITRNVVRSLYRFSVYPSRGY